MKQDLFSSRFGIVMATLGMAIGTGNLWRFPRQVAENGGGAFLIPWMVFLFTWSIPILIAEFTAGKASRRGPIGAFTKLSGKGTAWMGAFMAITTLVIASYYAVVTGWTLSYLVDALNAFFPALPGGFDQIPQAVGVDGIAAAKEASKAHFVALLDRQASLVPGMPDEVVWQLGSVFLVTLIVWGGVRFGVELASKILIPLLFALLIGAATYVLINVEGAMGGVRFLFQPDWNKLAEPKTWISGLTQSAWSTGAGWGLLLAYGAVTRRDADTVTNARMTGLGNNLASITAGLFLFPALFGLLSLAGMTEAQIVNEFKQSNAASTGLAFTIVPFVFKGAGEAGPWLSLVFFGGLFMAAFTSLISMFEMGTRVLMDFGLKRSGAVWLIALICGGLGVPSALDQDLFLTLDWTFGLCLLFGGIFLTWSVALYGVERFRTRQINPTADRPLSAAYSYHLLLLIPLQGAGLIGWWLWTAATDPGYYDPNGKGLSPFDPLALGTYGIGPLVIGCGSLLILLVAFSPWIGRASVHGEEKFREWGSERPRLWVRLLAALALAPLPWLIWARGSAILAEVQRRWAEFTGTKPGESGDRAWMLILGLIAVILVLNFARQAWIATRTPKPSAGQADAKPAED